MVRVKICCIMSEAEARLAVEAGASALGLVSRMPSGPGVIDDAEIAAIARVVPPGVSTFLLTCLQEPAAIVEQVRRCGTNTVQLCDAVAAVDYGRIRAGLPGVKIVQVIHVAGSESLEEAKVTAPRVDALLLDSGNPSLAVKELGGTGRRHDWSISREIVRQAGCPVFLAGGLNPANAAEAVAAVKPFGLDICSGVRTGGRLDEGKLREFFAAVRGV